MPNEWLEKYKNLSIMKIMSPLKLISLVIFFFLGSPPSWAYRRAISCNATELKTKSCPLEYKGYHLHFLKDKFLINNGIWRGLEPMMFKGDSVEWVKITLNFLAQRNFIEIEIWSPPQGEAALQDLHWLVYELIENKALLRLDKVVYKRSRSYISGEAYHFGKKLRHKLSMEKMPNNKKKSNLQKMENKQLQSNKDVKNNFIIHWLFDKESGVL